MILVKNKMRIIKLKAVYLLHLPEIKLENSRSALFPKMNCDPSDSIVRLIDLFVYFSITICFGKLCKINSYTSAVAVLSNLSTISSASSPNLPPLCFEKEDTA